MSRRRPLRAAPLRQAGPHRRARCTPGSQIGADARNGQHGEHAPACLRQGTENFPPYSFKLWFSGGVTGVALLCVACGPCRVRLG